MIDNKGYRLNVGIILSDQDNKVLWAKRLGQDAWQFPQGGIKANETPKQALFRELYEEIGLTGKQVQVLGATKNWLSYRLPQNLIRYHQRPLCIGQKQIWYLLRLNSKESDICFDAVGNPEFDHYEWVEYWQPAKEVVYFKRKVYEAALAELEPILSQQRSVDKNQTTTKVMRGKVLLNYTYR